MSLEKEFIPYEQALALKEIGFDVPTLTAFDDEDGILVSSYSENVFSPINYNTSGYKTSRPEQWQVVEWLRVNHGIWVYVVGGGNNRYYPMYQDKNQYKLALDLDKCYDTPQEAYSAAFDYILNNLI